MKNKTVTAELRKSIQKVTNQTNLRVFSDCRLNKQAVGVKVIQSNYSYSESYKIVSDMENKGFKLAYTKFNKGGSHGGYFSGTRFCFYKLSN